MPFEWFVAIRYLRQGRAQTLLILAAVSVGVAVLVFLSALINGLQTSLVKQTLGSQAHIVVHPPEEAARPLAPSSLATPDAVHVEKAPQRLRSIQQWQQVASDIERVRGVTAASPTIAGSAFVSRGNATKTVALRGIDPETYGRIIDFSQRMRAGAFKLSGSEALVGTELAKDLGVSVGDKLRVATPDERSDVFTISGVFDLGNKDVNQRWVLVPLRPAQTLLDLVGGASTIEVKVAEIFSADDVAAAIAARTGLFADSWMKTNSQLLVGLRSQNSSKYMIQFFVMVAVALGIASVLIVSVVQKSREIGILRAFGTSRARVMRVFLVQGTIVGLAGSLAGIVFGSALSLFFATMAKNPDGSATFPVDLNATLFFEAALLATAVGLGAAVIPARRAARLEPATVIRHG